MRRGGPLLVLVPTVREKQRLVSNRSDAPTLGDCETGDLRIEVCGFGVVAAAARSMGLIRDVGPSLVLLIGIAGTYDDSRLAIGEAIEFDEVVCDGIGVGQAHQHHPAGEMGFEQVPSQITGGPSGFASGSIGERVGLDPMGTLGADQEKSRDRVLVTVCAASADAEEAAQRRVRHPTALAEDMEGFGVAMSCRLAGVPLRIVRGASNRVGDREHARWRIGEALDAAARVAFEVIRRSDG